MAVCMETNLTARLLRRRIMERTRHLTEIPFATEDVRETGRLWLRRPGPEEAGAFHQAMEDDLDPGCRCPTCMLAREILDLLERLEEEVE